MPPPSRSRRSPVFNNFDLWLAQYLDADDHRGRKDHGLAPHPNLLLHADSKLEMVRDLDDGARHFYSALFGKSWVIDHADGLRDQWYLLDVLQYGNVGYNSDSHERDKPSSLSSGRQAVFQQSPWLGEKVQPRRGPLCTGMKLTAHGVGCSPVTAPKVDDTDVAHVFESYNGNSWGTLRDRLGTTTALVVFAQEIGFTEEEVGARGHTARALGWNMLCTPSLGCAAGKHSAGVAIFARLHVGLRWPDFLPRGVVVPRRLIFTIVDIPGWPSILCGCAYLYNSEGLTRRNLSILKSMGEVLEGQHLAIVGADWNLSSIMLEASGMPRRASMLILQSDVETCSTPQASTTIDYFVMSTAFAKLVDSTQVDGTWPKRPHRPVQARLRPGAVKLRQLVYQSHQRLPTSLPIGPTPAPQDWSIARAVAERANGMADDEGIGVGQTWEVMGEAWKLFSDVMERELEARLDTPVKTKGLKGKPLTAKWVSVLTPPRCKKENQVRVAQGWIWLQQTMGDLRGTCLRILSKADTLIDHSEVTAANNLAQILGQPFEAEGLDTRLDVTVQSARRLSGEKPQRPEELADWLERCGEALEEWDSDFVDARRTLDDRARESWDQWQTEALAGSARKMHKLTRLKAKWQPTVIETAPGIFSADPRKLLAREADVLGGYWDARASPDPLEVLDRSCLERLTPQAIRAASNSFSPHTAQSLDGVHVRQFSCMSDEGLETLACIFQTVEKIGVFPKAVYWMLFPLLEKPKGGLRPILLCAAPVRLWERLRRPVVNTLEVTHPRKFWAFGAGKSAESCIWNQAVKAEAQVSEGGVTAGFSWDGSKYYESFDLLTLKERGLRAGLNSVVIKVTYNFWRGPRILRLGTDHSLSPLYARNGLPAGSCLNDIFVRVYALEPFDGFVRRNPDVDLASYIDDDTVSSYGEEGAVLDTLERAARDLHVVFTSELGVNLAQDKLMTFASDPGTARRLGDRLGILAGEVGTHAVSLGCDLAPGGSRGARGHLKKRKQRFADMTRRHRLLRKYRKALPRERFRIGKIYTAGVKPALSFGDTVIGMTDGELKRGRNVLMSYQAPHHPGVSTRAKLVLNGDPLWRSMVAPALAWSHSVWNTTTNPKHAFFTIPQLRSMWQNVSSENLCWKKSQGPIGRMLLSLQRIGWEATSPFDWKDDLGNGLSLLFNTPSMMGHLLQKGVQRFHEKQLAEKLGWSSGARVCVDPIRRITQKSTKGIGLDARGKYLVKSLFCNGCWTEDRAQASGYLTDGLCPLCQQPDSVAHRLFRCTHAQVVQAREAVEATDVFLQSAIDGDVNFYTSLKWEHPAAWWPSMRSDDYPTLYDEQGNVVPWAEFDPSGLDVAGDGSCTPHNIAELSRAAYAWAFFNAAGHITHVARGSVWPSLPQTSQAAEQLQLAMMPILIPSYSGKACYSDCMNAVNLHNMCARDQTDGKRRYGGLRRGSLLHIRNEYAPAVHTPAHRKLVDIEQLAGLERWVGLANWRADVEAKQALALHPRPSEADSKKLDSSVKSLEMVARLAAAVLPLFPKAAHQRPPKRERKRKVFQTATGWHSWEPWLWGHRCASCLSFYGGDLAQRPEVGCGGFPERVRDLLVMAPQHGHVLASTQVESQAKPLLFCMVCGYFAQHRVCSLAEPCLQPRSSDERSSAGNTALSRLRRGLHPKCDWTVSCASREAPMSRQEADAYVGASRPQQTSASVAPLACLGALRARIAAKEEARRQQA